MPNTATVSYGDKTYTVTIDVQPAAGEDGMPTVPQPAIPVTGSTTDVNPQSAKEAIGGRKLRRTNRRGPGRPRKTRRYRRRSIRK